MTQRVDLLVRAALNDHFNCSQAFVTLHTNACNQYESEERSKLSPFLVAPDEKAEMAELYKKLLESPKLNRFSILSLGLG